MCLDPWNYFFMICWGQFCIALKFHRVKSAFLHEFAGNIAQQEQPFFKIKLLVFQISKMHNKSICDESNLQMFILVRMTCSKHILKGISHSFPMWDE